MRCSVSAAYPPFAALALRHMLAAISDGLTIRRILEHLGLPTICLAGPLPLAPARDPPQHVFAW